MNLGIIISSNDPETVWNAFRFGNYSLKNGDDVEIFLLGKGVEAENLDTEEFEIKQKMAEFSENGGSIHACGTCLDLRKKEGSKICPVSTMQDMYEVVSENDRVLTF